MDKVAEAVGKALKLHPGSAPAQAAGQHMPGAATLPGSDDADASRRRCAAVITCVRSSQLKPLTRVSVIECTSR